MSTHVISPGRAVSLAAATSQRATEARPTLEHVRRWMHAGLKDLAPDQAVLAIGCEGTFLTPQLAEYSSDVTVLDASASEIGQLARRFPEISFLQHQPASPLPFAHDTFHVIWCSEFLDRVFDPAAALREMHRVLAPGGRLLLTVPDHSAVRNVFIALFEWDEHFAPANPRIRHFTKRTLARLTRAAGFAAIRMTTAGAWRKRAGHVAPRTLMLQATKPPGRQPGRAGAQSRAAEAEAPAPEVLAFASRRPSLA